MTVEFLSRRDWSRQPYWLSIVIIHSSLFNWILFDCRIIKITPVHLWRPFDRQSIFTSQIYVPIAIPLLIQKVFDSRIFLDYRYRPSYVRSITPVPSLKTLWLTVDIHKPYQSSNCPTYINSNIIRQSNFLDYIYIPSCVISLSALALYPSKTFNWQSIVNLDFLCFYSNIIWFSNYLIA